jgi:hypothetical protein
VLDVGFFSQAGVGQVHRRIDAQMLRDSVNRSKRGG